MSDWHPSRWQLEAWVSGTVGYVAAASVEQHLPGCAACRQAVATCEGLPHLDPVWDAIREEIEPQQLNLVGRALLALGMPRGNALLVSSTPSLSTAWLLGMAITLLFAVAAAATSGARGVAFFLLIAPLAPLAGIAMAFGPDADPLYELTLAAPFSKFRLLLWRSVAVLASTIPLTVVVAWFAYGSWWMAAVWLIPAFAFASITLAATRWLAPSVTATAITLVWVAIQAPALRAGASLPAFSTDALVVYLILGVVAAVVFLTRASIETAPGRLP